MCSYQHNGIRADTLGGRPAASFAKRLMLPVSNDTLLRVVRRRVCLRTEPLNVVGVDDWAIRRNHRYGTIVCDLERRRIVTLLPDREIATVQAWLADHPEIKIVSRDRGGGYGEATAKALPTAIQVADRWHLMENASSTFLDAVRKWPASAHLHQHEQWWCNAAFRVADRQSGRLDAPRERTSPECPQPPAGAVQGL